ncbi:MAG: metallophosphoesterase [Segetibacter sp.]|jgi:Icc-related predicted phosphoesterase|nr:metallophosphoesterase [Segetibacter sp.]
MKAAYFIFLFSFSLFALSVKSQALPDSTLPLSNEIVFASDTQAPIWIETLWLKPNNNRYATGKIFGHILKRKPREVFLLGDVVSVGSSNKQWKRVNKYLKQLRSLGIQVNAALGNHDILFQSAKAQKKFQEYFPNHVKTGYVEIRDSVAVILLNSIYTTLSEKEDSVQVNWYRNTLEKLDSDPSIQFIITGCHHSPYTNSKTVGSTVLVQKRFVTSFLRSVKGRLFLSGHTHAFEHFNIMGKDFVVIGGGGGMYESLKKGKSKLNDLSDSYKPMFHYLTVKRQADKLQVTSIRLKTDFTAFEEGEKFYINKATGASVLTDKLFTGK